MIISAKEIFYCAMLLGYKSIVGVIYDFPHKEEQRISELNEVKRDLSKRKLLRENSRGVIMLDQELKNCIQLCAEPLRCTVIPLEKSDATLYSGKDQYLILQHNEEDMLIANVFCEEEAVRKYILQLCEGGIING